MGFTFSAKIQNSRSTISPDDIELVSFGLRKGEEVENFKPNEVGSKLDTILGKYKGMTASDAKANRGNSKKPLTLSWYPRGDQKPRFRAAAGTPLNIRITVINRDNGFKLEIVFQDVVLSRGKTEARTFPPDNFRRSDERFDGTFTVFVPDLS